MLIDEIEQRTNNWIRNVDTFETFVNAINVNYDSKDVVFTGWLHKLNTTQFKKVKRSECGRETDFKRHVFEYRGNIYYIRTSGICSIKNIGF